MKSIPKTNTGSVYGMSQNNIIPHINSKVGNKTAKSKNSVARE